MNRWYQPLGSASSPTALRADLMRFQRRLADGLVEPEAFEDLLFDTTARARRFAGATTSTVVDHEVERQGRIDRRLELVEELDEVHRVVACHHSGGDLAGRYVQRRDQRRGAVTDVLELASLGLAGLNTLRRMLAGFGLDPGLLVIDSTTRSPAASVAARERSTIPEGCWG